MLFFLHYNYVEIKLFHPLDLRPGRDVDRISDVFYYHFGERLNPISFHYLGEIAVCSRTEQSG